MSEKIVPVRIYVIACAAMVVLTVLTVVLALIDLRGWNTAVGLAIAAAQAWLSAVFFMHLRWSQPMIRLVAMVALLWLGILVVGTMDDILTRGWLAVPGK